VFICYLDEAGCTGELPTATSAIQPVLVMVGLIVHFDEVQPLTRELLRLKQRFYAPCDAGRPLDAILTEIGGSDLREDVRKGPKRSRRAAIGFLDHLLRLIEAHRCRIVGRLCVKEIGRPIDGTALYTSYVQSICRDFQRFLTEQGDRGLVIADARFQNQNMVVAHSIFTQMFQAAGNVYNRLVEMPVFGNSRNHAGLQIADMLSSAWLYPIGIFSYCLGHIKSVHVNENYGALKHRYGKRLSDVQYRYCDDAGRNRGGITVSDGIAHRSGGLLFR
jgi:hypothetical protein